MTKTEYDLTILESLRPEDRRRHELDGQCLVGPTRLFGLKVKYRHLDSRSEFIDAVEDYAGRSFALHLSAHGDESGLQTADYRFISWRRLCEAVKAGGEPSVMTLSSCAALANSNLPRSMAKKGLTLWLVGPSDPEGISFSDACTAFMPFYNVLSTWRASKPAWRPLSTLPSDKAMMRNGLDRMHASSDGDFRYYRWSESGERYVYNDAKHSAQRLVERFSEA